MESPKKNPRRMRTRCTKEFKLEALRPLQLGQKPATELALEFGVRRNQLQAILIGDHLPHTDPKNQ